MAITTRPAVGGDAAAVAVAHVRAWQVAYQGIVPADVLDSLDVATRTDQWRQNLTEAALADGTPAPTNTVAEVSGQVVGFACIGLWRDAPADTTSGELWAMYVHPDHWGTGAGLALMQTTFEHFRNEEVSTGYLWVLDDNVRARRFYERQGWRPNEVTQDDMMGNAMITDVVTQSSWPKTRIGRTRRFVQSHYGLLSSQTAVKFLVPLTLPSLRSFTR